MTVQTVKDVTDGAILGGKYRIRRVLGQGGMGVVVEAVHVELDDRVAIKFLTPRALAEPDAIQRFVREAKAAVRLRSEHIARVRDVGVLPGGDPYIVMEYLDGVELRQLFCGPRLAPSALVDLMLQACEGLAEAHSIGIVHRDIKPSNLFVVTQVDGAPHIKVLDFGVSKVPLDDLNLTGTNSWMGTPAYMSPEQMRSTKNVDPRSDLWSLAVVLYEGLEGRVPFPGDSIADLCINVTSMPPQPLTERTPVALGAVVLKGLAKSPGDRYESAAALAEALAPFAETTNHAEMIVRRTRRLLERRAPAPATGVPTDRLTGLRVVPVAEPPPTTNPSNFASPVSNASSPGVEADLAAAFSVMQFDPSATPSMVGRGEAVDREQPFDPSGLTSMAARVDASLAQSATGGAPSMVGGEPAGGGRADPSMVRSVDDGRRVDPMMVRGADDRRSGSMSAAVPIGDRDAVDAESAFFSRNDPDGDVDASGQSGRGRVDAERDDDALRSSLGLAAGNRRSMLGILAGVAALAVILAVVLVLARSDVEHTPRDTVRAEPDRSSIGSNNAAVTTDAAAKSLDESSSTANVPGANGATVTPDPHPDPTRSAHGTIGSDASPRSALDTRRGDTRAVSDKRATDPRSAPDARRGSSAPAAPDSLAPIDAGIVAPSDATPVVAPPDADLMGRRT